METVEEETGDGGHREATLTGMITHADERGARVHSVLIAARETEAWALGSDHMLEEGEQRQRHGKMKGDSGRERERTQGKELS